MLEGKGSYIYWRVACVPRSCNMDIFKLNPFAVKPKPCWALSIPLSLVLTTAVGLGTAFFIIANLTLLTEPTVTEKIKAAAPPLPFIYLCPSKRPYTMSGPIYVGCGDNISDTAYPLQRTPDGISTRAGGLCTLQQLVTIKIMDRDVGGPVDTQCVVFQHIVANKDIPWKTQVYMMLSRNQFTAGLSTTTLDTVPMGLNAYLSVYGPGNINDTFSLEANQGFLRNVVEINKVNGLQKYEEGAFFLPVSVLSAFKVQKISRIFQVHSARSLRTFAKGSKPKLIGLTGVDGSTTAPLPNLVRAFAAASEIVTTSLQIIKFTGVDGSTKAPLPNLIIRFTGVDGSTNAPLPNLVPGLIRLHGVAAADADDFEAAAASISISFDEVKYTEINQVGVILLLVGIIPVYLGMAAKLWAWVFAPFPKPGPAPSQHFLGYLRKAPEEPKKDEEAVPAGDEMTEQFMKK
ncbi:hypothetical protein KFL_004320050 [Klebsormidium nitens]|uniref:Uncharacterized protein n=1 Tax=Klebsormidium nitens TaxID=105231 RepID=A0A1Y1IG45_KLENI|nr:hypothetical protein KFL_004320050 [Klebsormidium nitens]|eukprot:GAQ88479.1 hypothetical protein KFL_004320050 [Klebsormidium nitens]